MVALSIYVCDKTLVLVETSYVEQDMTIYSQVLVREQSMLWRSVLALEIWWLLRTWSGVSLWRTPLVDALCSMSVIEWYCVHEGRRRA